MKGIEKLTGTEFAVKIIQLPESNEFELAKGSEKMSKADMGKEIQSLAGLHHENILQMKEYFEENNKVYLVTELLRGGELLHAVRDRKNYCEADARLCFSHILSGIRYLHANGIAHRDIKSGNLMLGSWQDFTTIKIIDLGLATRTADPMSIPCGTLHYVAPEVISIISGSTYTSACDLWSAGVMLYILLAGCPPFYNKSEQSLLSAVRRGRYSFDDLVWRQISQSAKDLISRLLDIDSKRRLTAEQALEHPWIKDTERPHEPVLDLTKRKLAHYLQNCAHLHWLAWLGFCDNSGWLCSNHCIGQVT